MTQAPRSPATTCSGHWAASVPVPRGEDPDTLAARLWALGALGVWERPGEVVGYFDRAPDDGEVLGSEPAAAGTVGGHLDGLPDATSWRFEPEVDHVAAWRAGARPVQAGGVEIVPHHLADEHRTPPGLHRILLDPGQAFGSGHHATTAGCLEVLDEVGAVGRRVLDLGTGTGILAIAAAKQGATDVLGVDTDPHALEVARRNASHNHVAPVLRVGSLGDVVGPFDLVLANLLTSTLVDLADDFPRVLGPGGWLVASGVGTDRAHVVVEAFTRAGLADVRVRTRGEWVVVLARGTGVDA